MKLLYFPLGFLVVLALFSLMGLGSGDLGGLNAGGDPASTVYYDYGGHAVCYGDCDAIGEDGWIYDRAGDAAWVNETGLVTQYYVLYWDNAHSAKVAYTDVGKAFPSNSYVNNISLSTSLGFIALVVGLMLLAVVVGIRVLGSGVSEESVSMIIKGTGLIAIWGVFSVLALGLIASGLVLSIVYFVLTLVYTLGIVNQVGHPGAD